ncbi:MAG TPA: ankyrin repeat domain-containing protein [Rhabdochlamydiaceae bacterium]|nr:ankyrin repeat domain-containing protein [Rhabdochlamydiaceae bacterium]HSX38345.1 ankyrin repeat domain-containing protein [Chlamydiales bacterium]
MSIPIVHPAHLYYNQTLFADVAENSLFSVFCSGDRIFDCLELATLEELFQMGAKINETDKKYGMNFLQWCIVEECSYAEVNEFERIVNWLFVNGIEIDHQDFKGRTALHLAVSEGMFDLAKMLLNQGANRSIVDANGRTAHDYMSDFVPEIMSDSDEKDREEILALLKIK